MPLSEIGIYYVIIGTQCCSSLRVTAKVLLAYYVDLAKKCNSTTSRVFLVVAVLRNLVSLFQ